LVLNALNIPHFHNLVHDIKRSNQGIKSHLLKVLYSLY
jgi:hypothetical protein